MKKFYLNFVALLAISCSTENIVTQEKVSLRFPKENAVLKEGDTIVGFRDVEVYIKSLQPFKLESPEIQEMIARDSATAVETYGYVQRRENYHIESGYFYNSGTGCFHYGMMIYGDNGVNTFIPASYATQIDMYPKICPPYGEMYAR